MLGGKKKQAKKITKGNNKKCLQKIHERQSWGKGHVIRQVTEITKKKKKIGAKNTKQMHPIPLG